MSLSLDGRHPIDFSIITQLVLATKSVISDVFLQQTIAAMFLLAFHRFLRIGEINVGPGVSLDHVIQHGDVDVVQGNNGEKKQAHLPLVIRHFKHQKFDRPVVLEIKSQQASCPVKYIRRYMRSHGFTPGSLYIFADSNPITRSYFIKQLSACLIDAGYNPNYTCHSFRIAAATTSAAKGFNDIQIQSMGRWKYTAFRRYIGIQIMQLYTLHSHTSYINIVSYLVQLL